MRLCKLFKDFLIFYSCFNLLPTIWFNCLLVHFHFSFHIFHHQQLKIVYTVDLRTLTLLPEAKAMETRYCTQLRESGVHVKKKKKRKAPLTKHAYDIPSIQPWSYHKVIHREEPLQYLLNHIITWRKGCFNLLSTDTVNRCHNFRINPVTLAQWLLQRKRSSSCSIQRSYLSVKPIIPNVLVHCIHYICPHGWISDPVRFFIK